MRWRRKNSKRERNGKDDEMLSMVKWWVKEEIRKKNEDESVKELEKKRKEMKLRKKGRRWEWEREKKE